MEHCCRCNGTYRLKKTPQGLLCKHHRDIFRKFGCFPRTQRTPNELIIDGDITYICLYNIKSEEVARAIIDTEDICKINKYKWHMTNIGYVLSGNRKIPHIYLHRIILDFDNVVKNIKDGKKYVVDHINGDKLDNRKSNLRICTNSQNIQHRTRLCSNSTSKIHGVTYDKSNKIWRVDLTADGVKFLKRFATKEEAIVARKAAEIKYFGEYRPTFDESSDQKLQK